MKNTVIASTLAALFAFATPAFADPGGPGFFKMGRMLHGLKLTEAQEDQAIAMRKELQKEGKRIKKNAMESVDEVAAELRKPKPDASRLHNLADQRMDEVKKLVHLTIDRFLALHATLTQDQKSELADKLEKHQRRAQKWEED